MRLGRRLPGGRLTASAVLAARRARRPCLGGATAPRRALVDGVETASTIALAGGAAELGARIVDRAPPRAPAPSARLGRTARSPSGRGSSSRSSAASASRRTWSRPPSPTTTSPPSPSARGARWRWSRSTAKAGSSSAWRRLPRASRRSPGRRPSIRSASTSASRARRTRRPGCGWRSRSSSASARSSGAGSSSRARPARASSIPFRSRPRSTSPAATSPPWRSSTPTQRSYRSLKAVPTGIRTYRLLLEAIAARPHAAGARPLRREPRRLDRGRRARRGARACGSERVLLVGPPHGAADLVDEPAAYASRGPVDDRRPPRGSRRELLRPDAPLAAATLASRRAGRPTPASRSGLRWLPGITFLQVLFDVKNGTRSPSSSRRPGHDYRRSCRRSSAAALGTRTVLAGAPPGGRGARAGLGARPGGARARGKRARDG